MPQPQWTELDFEPERGWRTPRAIALLPLALVAYGLSPSFQPGHLQRDALVVGAGVTLIALVAWASLRSAAVLLLLLQPALYLLNMAVPDVRAHRWPMEMLIPVGITLIVGLLFSPLRHRLLRWLRPGRFNLQAIVLGLAIAAVSVGVLLIWFRLIGHGQFQGRGLMSEFGTGRRLAVAAGVFAIVNAALEEITFRGLLQPALLEITGDPYLAIGGQAAIFGMMHLGGFPRGVIGCFLAGLYGICQGSLRKYTGGLLVPILSHALVDAAIATVLIHAY